MEDVQEKPPNEYWHCDICKMSIPCCHNQHFLCNLLPMAATVELCDIVYIVLRYIHHLVVLTQFYNSTAWVWITNFSWALCSKEWAFLTYLHKILAYWSSYLFVLYYACYWNWKGMTACCNTVDCPTSFLTDPSGPSKS